jgi:hypothetical protein
MVLRQRVPGAEVQVEHVQQLRAVRRCAGGDLRAHGRVRLADLAEVDGRHVLGGLDEEVHHLPLLALRKLTSGRIWIRAIFARCAASE